MRKLLDAQAAGHAHDVNTWRDAIVGSLDDEKMVQGASDMVNHGEKFLNQIQELKTSATVARVFEHLESEDLEHALLERLHLVDPEAMVASMDAALTDVQMREALVGEMKDTCLDFLLKILPAIHIDELTGHDKGCDWEINDINFSDFHFKKENVHIQLGDPTKPHEELLRVSAWDISAHFRKLKVTVKQTQLPYITTTGVADARAERMSVTIAFMLTATGEGDKKKPELVVSSRAVHMEHLELWISETNYAIVVNALSFLFADVLKSYACGKIQEHLDENMSILIEGLNTAMQTMAPLLKRMGFAIALPEAAPKAIDDFNEPPEEPPEHAGPEPVLLGRRGGAGAKDFDFPILEWPDPGRTFRVRE